MARIRAIPPPERIRFEGRYLGAADGDVIYDRTTLSREARGHVRQLIEISKDAGETWAPVFDAEYRPAD